MTREGDLPEPVPGPAGSAVEDSTARDAVSPVDPTDPAARPADSAVEDSTARDAASLFDPPGKIARPVGNVIGLRSRRESSSPFAGSDPAARPAENVVGSRSRRETASLISALAAGPRTREAIDAFLASQSIPIVLGSSMTFVYRGDAEAVHLKHWVFGLPSSQQLKRLEGTDLWHLTLEIPAGSRVEYKLEVVRGGRGEWIQDPLNPNRARDPFGANSVAHGTGYTVPEWIKPDPEAPPGTIDEIRFHSQVFGRRGVGLYLPARYRRTRRYPLLIVHDGHDYLRYASLGPILDNLIYRREIPDLIVALTSSANRLGEYAADERHARFLSDELVPNLERTLPLDARPQSRCLMGASFGAVAALTTALARPGFYGRLLLQSGSFAFTDIGDRNARGPLFDPIVAAMNHYRANPIAMSERVFISCGMYESLIYENRSLAPILAATGMEMRYVEARDGHNWENWRDRLREGLSWLFPGPLLLVYE